MALLILLGLSGIGVASGLAKWRYALLVAIVIAAVQDPLRKLVPGAPGYLVLLTAPVLVSAILGMLIAQPRLIPRLYREHPKIALTSRLLVLGLLPAASLSLTYGPGSWQYTILGLFSYGMLVFSIYLGYAYPRKISDIRRILVFYCVVSSVLLSGAFVEYLNLLPNSVLIGTKALNMEWIRYDRGYVVELIAGFHRSPDVMGWHAATVAMFSLILSFSSTGAKKFFWIALFVFAVSALILCGRRKMVFMIPVFIAAVLWMIYLAGRAKQWISVVGIIMLPLASLFVLGTSTGDESDHMRYYTQSNNTPLDRLYSEGVLAMQGTYSQNGFLGAGLGFATPGSHHINASRPRIWQESGPSRVLVELGVPGLLALVMFFASVVGSGWQRTLSALKAGSDSSVYSVGLLAFFFSNIASLFVSGQILADPFAAAFLGISIGMALATDRFTRPRRHVLSGSLEIGRMLLGAHQNITHQSATG